MNEEERQFWDEIILNDDGSVDIEAVYAELSDFRQLMHHASRVYYDITCGIISKPNTDSSDVISQANQCADDIKRDEILDVLEQIKSGDMTLDEALEEYRYD
jgi:hypothetical protein